MFKLSKTETEERTAKFGFGRSLEYVWRPGKVYDASDYARPTIPNGFEYQSTAGQSGAREPKWPTSLGGTVTDGSITWTAVAFATNATDTIASVNLEAPAGITVGTASIDGVEVSFEVSGGTKGTCYIISVEVTTAAGEVLEEKLEVFIDGD